MTYSWGVAIGSPLCGVIASCALYSGGGGSGGPYDGGWRGWTPNPPKKQQGLIRKWIFPSCGSNFDSLLSFRILKETIWHHNGHIGQKFQTEIMTEICSKGPIE